MTNLIYCLHCIRHDGNLTSTPGITCSNQVEFIYSLVIEIVLLLQGLFTLDRISMVRTSTFSYEENLT